MLHKNILMIRDENALGDVYHSLELSFDKLEVTVEDIITERVYQEVIKYNQKANQYRHALVQPNDRKHRLNQTAKQPKTIDPHKQVEIALTAFANNGFFMLIDEVQAEHIQQLVTIKADTVVSFIKLTPLVGG